MIDHKIVINESGEILLMVGVLVIVGVWVKQGVRECHSIESRSPSYFATQV